MKQTVKFSQVKINEYFWYNDQKFIKFKLEKGRPYDTMSVGRRFSPNDAVEIEAPYAEITSGLGIGGAGSDDYNIHTEGDTLWTTLRDQVKPGEQFEPTGTTQGTYTPGERCARCGREGNWNPGAGETLCNRHWDEY